MPPRVTLLGGRGARVFALASVAAVAAAGCQGSQSSPRGPADTAGATAGARQAASADTPVRVDTAFGLRYDSLLGNAQRLRYDTVAGAGDEQRLMVGAYPNARYGPLVRIEPESTAVLATVDELARGRVIARFVNRTGEGYPKLGIAPNSTTYWWVGRRSDGSWVSVYVSSDAKQGMRLQRGLVPHEHRGHRWQQSLARWVWSDRDEGGWATCTATRCCSHLETGFQ